MMHKHTELNFHPSLADPSVSISFVLFSVEGNAICSKYSNVDLQTHVPNAGFLSMYKEHNRIRKVHVWIGKSDISET